MFDLGLLVLCFKLKKMDKLLLEVSVMVLGEIIRSPKYDEDNVENAVSDAVTFAKLLIKEINQLN